MTGRELMTVGTTLMRNTSPIPVDVTSFVGRRRELTEIRRLVGDARLVTLAGVGGVGKTRLALRAATELGRAFPAGVVVVELTDRDDPGLVPAAVAAAFGMDDAEALPDFLQGKRVLLVLDNCEHLLDACAELAGWLLSATTNLSILTTSRQPLGIMGEHVLAVPSLGVPDPGAATELSTLDQYDAVSLFVARARASCPGFTLTEANHRHVIGLCHQLDGVPLAIELAAARLRAFSVEQILDRLGDRFRLLTAGNRIARPRHRTLRGLIDWSFCLCSETERTLWGRLSVFVGGFDLAAAQAVCAVDPLTGDDVVDVLAALVEKSIVARTESAEFGVAYRMLETIRHYGQDRLAETGALAELRRRHRDFFAALASQAEAGWMGADQFDWYVRIRANGANLRLALDFCLTEPGEGQAALELATTLCNFRRAYPALGEGRRFLDRALALTPRPSPARAKGLWVSAWLALLQGDGDAADRLLAECRELAERIADPVAMAYATQFTGLARCFAGDFAGAIELLRQAADQHEQLGNRAGLHVSYGQLTMSLCFAGDPEAAIRIKAAMEAIQAQDSPVSHTYLLWYTAIERFFQGDPVTANARAAQALRMPAASVDQWLTMLCLETLAWTAAARDQHGRAARLLGVAESARRAMGSALGGLGHLRQAHAEAAARAMAALGESAFAAQHQAGLGLGEPEAIAYATAAKAEATRDAGNRTPLTRRELEIAELVGKGMSNKEIAAALVIAPRTAETHVEHILTKLAFTRRTQIAAWVTEHRVSAAI